MPPPKFAPKTTVSHIKTRGQIEKEIEKYGCKGFQYYDGATEQHVGFEIEDRKVAFELPIPDPQDEEFTHTATGIKRTAKQALCAWEQIRRQRWRALLLSIKAKLEAIDCGISTVHEQFLGETVLPNGQTVNQCILPTITHACETGQMQISFNGKGS